MQAKESGGPIKIGRISLAVERALGVSLTSDVGIYMEEGDLNALAAARPANYLELIDEIAKITKSPDFVHYQQQEEVIEFVRFYFKAGKFQMVSVYAAHCGKPKRWHYRNMTCAILARAKQAPLQGEYSRLK